MATKRKTVGCGDWHRSWGYGTNHIGNLQKGEAENTYIWKGHCQGRHGQVWNRGMVVTFEYTAKSEDPVIIIISTKHEWDSLPDFRDVEEAIKILENG